MIFLLCGESLCHSSMKHGSFHRLDWCFPQKVHDHGKDALPLLDGFDEELGDVHDLQRLLGL
ncbi:hypothetical protein, partial [Microbispora hainanensis]|uniref:hypothetical protein n=1 Tax=Microbispora hainanensis TaxID=568844 RepID=UPI0033D2D7A1